MHRWEEVTAAGLLLLAAARACKRAKGTERGKAQEEDTETHETQYSQSRDLQKEQRQRREKDETEEQDGRNDANVCRDRPALLVYGACDGLLASFLAQHAPEALQTHSHRCPFVQGLESFDIFSHSNFP